MACGFGDDCEDDRHLSIDDASLDALEVFLRSATELDGDYAGEEPSCID
jgi:hypothetical protein